MQKQEPPTALLRLGLIHQPSTFDLRPLTPLPKQGGVRGESWRDGEGLGGQGRVSYPFRKHYAVKADN